MALSNQDQAQIRDYLLGHLNNEEQQTIEERLMVEDDLFEEFEISKGELIEEYRAGELNRKDNRWFESHYLASPEGKQRQTFAVAIDCLKRPTPEPQRLTWLEQVASFVNQKRWAVATVAPVLLASIALALVLTQFYGSEQNTLAVTLETHAFDRAPSETKYRRIQVTSDVGEVKFELKLPDTITPSTNYLILLDDRSGKTKTLNVIGDNTRTLSVIISAGELAPGLYALKLSAINADGATQRIGDYFFEIVN